MTNSSIVDNVGSADVANDNPSSTTWGTNLGTAVLVVGGQTIAQALTNSGGAVSPMAAPSVAPVTVNLTAISNTLGCSWPADLHSTISPNGSYTTAFCQYGAWDYLGPATPLYQFGDTNARASPWRYYRLRWP